MIHLPFAPEGDTWARARARTESQEVAIAARARMAQRRAERSLWRRFAAWLRG